MIYYLSSGHFTSQNRLLLRSVLFWCEVPHASPGFVPALIEVSLVAEKCPLLLRNVPFWCDVPHASPGYVPAFIEVSLFHVED